jgi:hypothetical protein
MSTGIDDLNKRLMICSCLAEFMLMLVSIHDIYVEPILCVLLGIMLEGISLAGICINVVSPFIYLHPANCMCLSLA